MYIKYSQLDTYWYIENSLDFCICKCLNSDSSRVMNLGVLWVPLHRVPSPSKIAAEERLTENHHRQGLWWAYGTSNSNQKKRTRLSGCGWFMVYRYMSFFVCKQAINKIRPQGESTSFKKRGWKKKKTTQLMGILLGLHRSMLILLTDYMVILLFVCWLLKLTQ